MSDDTGTIRILDADPELVVSVTVGELKRRPTMTSSDERRKLEKEGE